MTNKNTLTSQLDKYYDVINYDDRPYGHLEISHREFLGIDNFKSHTFGASDGKQYTVTSLAPSVWQRSTEAHAKKVTGPNGHFHDLNAKSRYVDATLYMGPRTVLNDEHDIPTGQLYMDDSHTRQYVMAQHYKGKPVNKDLQIRIPDNFLLLITITDDAEDLKRYYDSCDQKKASKDKRDQVQSALRGANMLTNLKTDFCRQGQFASSIDVAVPLKKSSPIDPDWDLIDQLTAIRNPLEHMDKMFSTIPANNTNIAKQYQILGILLNLLNKNAWGTSDGNLNNAITRLIANEENPQGIRDGVWWLINLYDGNSPVFNQIVDEVKDHYLQFKPKLNKKDNNITNIFPLAKGMVYYERIEGPNLVVFLLLHSLQHPNKPVDWKNINWKKDIANKYSNLIDYVWNGRTSI